MAIVNTSHTPINDMTPPANNIMENDKNTSSEDKPWGVNFSGPDFLVNYPMRSDLITSVQPVPFQQPCVICQVHNPDTGVSLATAMEFMVKTRSYEDAMAFLQSVNPEIATWENINIHFNHGIKDPDDKLEFQIDSLIDVHYRAGMSIGREFAMAVTANGSQYLAPNEKNIKCLSSPTSGMTKLIQTKMDLRKIKRKHNK